MGGWSGCFYLKLSVNLIMHALPGLLLELQIKSATELARGPEDLQCSVSSSLQQMRNCRLTGGGRKKTCFRGGAAAPLTVKGLRS